MLRSATIATCIIGVAAAVGVTASHALDIRLEARASSYAHAAVADSASMAALPMRLVDAGGVGIAADTTAWGTNYSHGTGAFHSLIRSGDVDVDGEAFARIARDWRVYIDRMAQYGSTGVVVGAFLELIDFDRVGDGERVYAADSEFRRRHAGLRSAFGDLFAYARNVGMDVYLKTDMLALTPPLERMLGAEIGGLDTMDPALWAVYAAGLDELFSAMPDVRGVVIRIGEAGSLYNLAGWEYRTELAVRTPEQLQLMLSALLPVFERHGRNLVLRSWSVGVGRLGDLHTDPAVYDAVLGDIDSPNLIVSTKFTQGDFFSYLPLNPTLATGKHRRIIEFQARREFEAFSAFPNYLAADHAHAIRTFARANPNVIGTSLWTQEGGPLHAGPMSLYPLHGFWYWIDANVHATASLARDPTADPAELAAEWVRATISTDPVVVAGLTQILLQSRDAVRNGLYVRPFAETRVRVAGVEATPMMWIMEWDVVGDWTAIASTVYRTSKHEIDATIAEGFEAVQMVAAMRRTLADLGPFLEDHAVYAPMQRSLAYEQSLFESLAWYRMAMLSYYRWLDTGDEEARMTWDKSASQFRATAAEHARVHGSDLDFPAYDFAPALGGLQRAERSMRAADFARATLATFAALLIGLAAVKVFGGSYALRGWSNVSRAPVAPWRLPGEATAWAAPVIGAATLLACALTSTSLFAFEAKRLALGSVVLLATFAVGLEGAWYGPSLARRGGHALAALGPVLLAALATLAVIAVRGSDYFWFQFWSDAPFRAFTVAGLAAVTLWVLACAFVTGRRKGINTTGALGATFVAAGVALIVMSVLLPDLPALLASFDQPLSMLPIRFALVAALTEYANLPANAPFYPAVFGAVLLVGGAALRTMSRRVPEGHAPEGQGRV